MTWREFIKVHPAAALFPPLPADELIQLEESVRQHGLQVKAKLWKDSTGELWLIDGATRFDIVERIHRPSTQEEWLKYAEVDEAPESEKELTHRVLAANIHRRHLSAEQRAELAVQILKTELQQIKFRKDAQVVVQKAASVGDRIATYALIKELGKTHERTPSAAIDEIAATTGASRTTVKNILQDKGDNTARYSQGTIRKVRQLRQTSSASALTAQTSAQKCPKQSITSTIYQRDEQFIAAVLKLAEKPDYVYTDQQITNLISVRKIDRFLRCVVMLPWLKIQRDRSGTKFTVDHDLRNFCEAHQPGTVKCDNLVERLTIMWTHIITIRREQKMEAERAKWYPGDIEVAEVRLLFDYIEQQLREMIAMPQVPRKTNSPKPNSHGTLSDVAAFNKPPLTKEVQ